MDIAKGIAIMMNRWLEVRRDELIHLITDETHLREAEEIYRWARGSAAVLKTTVLPSQMVQAGDVVEGMADVLSKADVIIGATDYSFITTSAVGEATRRGARFLSLPLSCTDGTSLLENDFIDMDPVRARRDAQRLLKKINASEHLRVTTNKGTDIAFRKRGRTGGCFNGCAARRGDIASASFEAYVAIEEDKTEGRLILDASLGYLGVVKEEILLAFSGGRLKCLRENEDAERLLRYIRSFRDEKMYHAAEFGIGLNRLARCRGVSYIEDESTYGTFHIGLGRNISLGGIQQAAGHFDIVTYRPTIYADGEMLMRDGELL